MPGFVTANDLIPFLIASFALIASPGPNTLTIAASGAAFGSRRSLPIMAGLVSGMVIVMAMTATGLAGLVLTVPGAIPVVSGLVVAYFVYLAFRIATAPPLGKNQDGRRPPSFSGGLTICIANPKAYAAMTAVFSGFLLVHDSPMADALAKIGLLTVMIILVNIAWLLTGVALTRLFRDPRANRSINLAFAGMLLATLVLMQV